MRLVFIFILTAALSGCALRPRYGDFVTSRTEGKEVTFLVTDVETNQPVANARVEISELRNRLSVITASDGTFKLPVERKYLEENPVFVVALPKGVQKYRVTLVAAPAPAPAPAPAIDLAPDAGSPASNG